MILKPKYTTYDIYIRDDSEDLHVLKNSILNGLTIRIPIPDTMEKYRIPHEIASHIEAELQTYMLTEGERQQAKQEEKAAYEKGLADAWEAARKIVMYEADGGLRTETTEKIFGTLLCGNIFKDFDASEAIAKIKDYEEKQNEIKVGDEVVENDDISKRGVVTYINLTGSGNMYNVLWDDGQSCGYYKKGIKKTDRHFPQVKELLKAMKGE